MTIEFLSFKHNSKNKLTIARIINGEPFNLYKITKGCSINILYVPEELWQCIAPTLIGEIFLTKPPIFN